VLYDFDVFNRHRFGGIARYFVELIRHMPADLAEVYVFTGLHINEMLENTFPTTGIRVPSLPKTATVREWVNQAWLNVLLSSRKTDIYHKTLYCKWDPPAKAKLIITLHDLATARFPELFKGIDPDTAIKRYWANRADAILAVSETTRRDAIEILGVSPDKIAVTRLGVRQQEPTLLQKSVSPHERPFLLYVGMRYDYKNFNNLVKAYAQSAATRTAFDLICFGGGKFSYNEKSLFLHSGTEGCIHFRSGNDAALLHYYLHARALVLPSRHEGFGLPLLEAMNAGCPLLCSDIPTTREVAGNAAAYFPALEVDAISAIFDKVLFDEELLAKNVALGRERVKTFSWRRCAAETAAVYRSVI